MHFTVRPASPDFKDLPWDYPLSEWVFHSTRIDNPPRGLSRHTVVFVNYSGILYALKELPQGLAEKEFRLLSEMETARIPVVTPVGYVNELGSRRDTSVLITRYLEHSLPYRSLFMSDNLARYRVHLLDAIAGLLVQLHLAEVYWGDCSLSNTLFRRDAGALRAYLVDAETANVYENIPAAQRFTELEIMEENVDGDLGDLRTEGLLAEGVPISDTGAYIRLQYHRLWEEITREEVVAASENYRIQERVRALNQLGFSVGEVELAATENGDQLRLRIAVTDRNFHHDQLQNLTGLDVQEQQARLMMNEIHELKARLSQANNRSTALSVAACQWLEEYYQPVISQLKDHPSLQGEGDYPERYCQILEHKWFLSERARRDVGHQNAAQDYINQYARQE